jgi:hypothetical protein
MIRMIAALIALVALTAPCGTFAQAVVQESSVPAHSASVRAVATPGNKLRWMFIDQSSSRYAYVVSCRSSASTSPFQDDAVYHATITPSTSGVRFAMPGLTLNDCGVKVFTCKGSWTVNRATALGSAVECKATVALAPSAMPLPAATPLPPPPTLPPLPTPPPTSPPVYHPPPPPDTCTQYSHPTGGCDVIAFYNVGYCGSGDCSLHAYVGVPFDAPLTGTCWHGTQWFTPKPTNLRCGTWSAQSVDIATGTLPPGLRIDRSTWRLTGVPTRAGQWNLTILVYGLAGDGLRARASDYQETEILHFTTEGSAVPRSL